MWISAPDTWLTSHGDNYISRLAFSPGQGLSGSALVDRGPPGEDPTYVCAQ